MAFVIPILAAIGGGSAAAGAVTVAAAGYGAVKANQTAQAAKGAANKAATASQIDINKLNDQVSTQAESNLAASRALEAQYDPQNQQLRAETVQHLLTFLQGGQGGQDYQTRLAQQNPLLAQAYGQAQGDLSRPGMLPQDVINEIARHSLSVAGGTNPGGNLGLGRDITARDLGLNSLQLHQQQLSNASQAASQADSSMGQGYQQLLSAAQFAQGIRPPAVGLDPSSVGNLSIANQNFTQAALANQANVAGQQSQSYMNLAGQFAGYGLSNYAGAQKTATIPANTPQASIYPTSTPYQGIGPANGGLLQILAANSRRAGGS